MEKYVPLSRPYLQKVTHDLNVNVAPLTQQTPRSAPLEIHIQPSQLYFRWVYRFF